MSDSPDTAREGRVSTDRTTIRDWATEHDAVPVREADAEGERYRIVRERDVGSTHTEAEWDDFFTHLDENDHVVIYHEEGAGEPFDVAHRDEAVSRSDLERDEFEERLIEGETVTSTFTETSVVESVVREEATVESELVESEMVDQTVADVELVHRDCTTCDLVDEGGVTDRDWFDDDRYFETAGGAASPAGTVAGDDYPFYADLQVEETWSVTREFTERFTVESRITDVDVEGTDTVEDVDVDVGGLQRDIAESGLLEVGHSTDHIMTEYDVRTEFHEGESVLTHFEREMVVEDEVVDRRQLRADVTEGELLGMEIVRSEDIVAGVTDDEAPTGVESGETASTGEAAGPGMADLEFDDDQIGKTVIDATGDEVGMVTDVDPEARLLHVDVQPGITERIKAALDWGDVADDDYPVTADQIQSVSDDEIRLREREDLVSGTREE